MVNIICLWEHFKYLYLNNLICLGIW
jgi:hypothetical protein